MPDKADQEFFYHLAYQVKAGDQNYDKEGLLARLQILRSLGAECFVLGCTEIPVAFSDMGITDDVIDTSLELARAALQAAGYEVKA
jgi:aspartate racemase